MSSSTKLQQTTRNKKKRSTHYFFLLVFFYCPLKCLSFKHRPDAAVITPALHILHIFPIMHSPSKKEKTKAALLRQLLSLSFIKTRRRSPDRDRSMCLFVSLTQDFCYNSLPVYPSFPSSSDAGRVQGETVGGVVFFFLFFFFTVINTCTQSFNLPYLSHVTVWLHCLIWESFNLSRPRLEINEGRTRRALVAAGLQSAHWLNRWRMSLTWRCCSPPPSPSLYFSSSLFSCFTARCSTFFSFFISSTPSPSRRSARGPFGVRHLCSVIQSATALFIPDLFGALESPSLICEKILYFFYLVLFFPIHRLPPIIFLAAGYFSFFGGCRGLIWFDFILLFFIYLIWCSTQGTEGKKMTVTNRRVCQVSRGGCFITAH